MTPCASLYQMPLCFARKKTETVHQNNKGRVCVTGGTGFLGSWMVKRLLEDGYSVNATIRMDPDRKRDISFLTNLPGASERLHVYNADLDKPDAFAAAVRGCAGVFHMAHPIDFAENEPEEVKIKRATTALECILRACADSETVRRVVYTSSVSAAAFSTTPEDSGMFDEKSWTDVEFIRSLRAFAGHYIVTKTLTEKAALDIAGKLGLDLVSVLPTWVTGPFISPGLPDSVDISMALIFGDDKHYAHMKGASLVHVDDVARAHIHLFEQLEAKGRYLVAGAKFKIEDMCDMISTRYPEFKMPNPDSWKDIAAVKVSGVSTKKLEETGFVYENGLEEMFDGAIKSCRERGLL